MQGNVITNYYVQVLYKKFLAGHEAITLHDVMIALHSEEKEEEEAKKKWGSSFSEFIFITYCSND